MVISIGGSPSAFTLDQNIGEFVLTNASLSIPPQGKIYSINEGNASFWDPPTTKYATN
jgi:fructose-1,6-bisphosphatase I